MSRIEVFTPGVLLVVGYFRAIGAKLVHLTQRVAHFLVLGVFMGGLLLTGCTTQTPEVRTVRVEVPVTVPCRAPAVSVPAWAASGLKKADSLEVKVRALLAERRQRIGYERELVAATTACR